MTESQLQAWNQMQAKRQAAKAESRQRSAIRKADHKAHAAKCNAYITAHPETLAPDFVHADGLSNRQIGQLAKEQEIHA